MELRVHEVPFAVAEGGVDLPAVEGGDAGEAVPEVPLLTAVDPREEVGAAVEGGGEVREDGEGPEGEVELGLRRGCIEVRDVLGPRREEPVGEEVLL